MGDSLQKTLGTERHLRLVQLLIEARERSGMTQTELAEALGEYQSFVARVESGQRRIDVVEYLTIAETLGLDPATGIAEIVGSEG